MTKVTFEEIEDLRKLLTQCSEGNWSTNVCDRLWNKSIEILAPSKSYDPASPREVIASVPREKIIFNSNRKKFSSPDEPTIKTTITEAEFDAELIVRVKNILPRLLDAVQQNGYGQRVYWVVEFSPTRHHPVRYYSVGEEPVVDRNHATQFSREKDAKDALFRDSHGFGTGKAVEITLTSEQEKEFENIPQ